MSIKIIVDSEARKDDIVPDCHSCFPLCHFREDGNAENEISTMKLNQFSGSLACAGMTGWSYDESKFVLFFVCAEK